MIDELSSLEQWLSLRRHILFYVVILASVAAVIFSQSDSIFAVLQHMLVAHSQSTQTQLISTNLITPLTLALRIAIELAFIMSLPLLMLQVWMFVAPALYSNEKKQLRFFLLAGMLLFLLGLSLAWWFVIPNTIRILSIMVPETVALFTEIETWYLFCAKLLWVFGISFELPLLLKGLVMTHIIKRKRLVQGRPYAVVGSFVLAMLLTPPDVVSQIALALPLCVLYELGLLWTRRDGGYGGT